MSRTAGPHRMAMVTLALAVLCAGIPVLPHTRHVWGAWRALATTREQVWEVRERLERLDTIEAERDQLAAAVLHLESFVPPGGGLSELLEELSSVAAATGVKILSLVPEPAPQPDGATGYQAIAVRVRAVAGYHEFGRFLSVLEGGPRFTRASDVEILTSRDDPEHHRISLSLATWIVAGGAGGP